MAVAIVVAASAFFFIPTTLIILGYYTSQPTGTLISPIPQGVLSEIQQLHTTPSITPEVIPDITPSILPDNTAIVADPSSSTKSAETQVVPEAATNIIDKTATISANVNSVVIQDKDVREDSQIYLSPRLEDKSTYSVLSKTAGSFTISVVEASDVVRYVDYHIVNP